MSNGFNVTGISSMVSRFLQGGRLSRIAPEPRSRLVNTFGSALRTAGDVISGDLSGLGDYADLIHTQIEAQRQMQLVSLHSNIEKSRHESKMAAIRNVRTG